MAKFARNIGIICAVLVGASLVWLHLGFAIATLSVANPHGTAFFLGDVAVLFTGIIISGSMVCLCAGALLRYLVRHRH